ncbi:MAG: prepilin-type N-terminal cleavage/methylation domain-containing protein [Roseateles sp.]|uniref:Tfp pilus assembly protein FimT/FimU n=1 Tax=Roseateles sp. TaxID=1971397 RepID=UPI0039EC4CBD
MPRASRGFTLVELVLVIVIMAALAVFALPQVLDTTLWRLRAFGDELQSRHQALQRLALQQRRPIVATFTGTGVSWAYAAGGELGSLPCPAAESPCIAEGGSRSVTFNSANSGATATGSGTDLTVTVAAGSYSQAYRVVADTGLIHPLP